MAQNFIDYDRDQAFLLPPSLRDWLAEDHLAWFVIDAVDRMDLAAFYAANRADGHGRAAYEPSVMVALVLYSFCTDVRSARAMGRHCRQDIAFRVVAGNQVPDHATIARFIARHETALAGLFSAVLRLCDRAGLVASEIVSIDGTKLHANASRDANLDYDQLAADLVAGVIAADQAEDERLGDRRGDELPEELQTVEGRRAWLERELAQDLDDDDGHALDAERIVARIQGRAGWLREAKRQQE